MADDCLGRQEKSGHTGGVLQSDTADFGRVDNARLDQVRVLTSRSVEADIA
jgi:hypothetical protein